MKLLALVFALLAGIHPSFAQSSSAALMPGLGQLRHTISTKNPEAQRFFDQGLTLVFVFNHEEAARAFRRASELDLQSAMAFWGIALALGPCINNPDIDPPHSNAAYEAVQRALSLAPGATERERAYVQALAKRYSSDPKVDLRKLDAQYADAMRELHKHYPDDLDAATLYAESLMDLHPWKQWTLDGGSRLNLCVAVPSGIPEFFLGQVRSRLCLSKSDRKANCTRLSLEPITAIGSSLKSA